MTIRFPAEWQGLHFPGKRAELLEYLAEIVSVAPGSDPRYREFEVDELVHFLFDDTNLGSRLESAVGDILLDDVEESCIRELTVALESVIRELGDSTSREYLAHPRWPEIVGLASRALRELRKHGAARIEP
jgi:hypothetical protein